MSKASWISKLSMDICWILIPNMEISIVKEIIISRPIFRKVKSLWVEREMYRLGLANLGIKELHQQLGYHSE